MSIQLAAKHLAAHGRGPDTTLVHMTPGEVASLQALAQQHGGSLSINPQTGLPEAGFLSALLPMAAGAGLAAMGMPAGYAALSVGAASAATNGGDMKKAILNGFSAYTGAGMAGAFMDAGAMGASAAAPATVLEVPPGGSSVYSLGSSAAPSTAEYSLGKSSSYLNKPEYFSLASAAPAQAAQAAAAATPAAQQAAALQSMDIGQRFDALKAGATGTNALNYIKANPFASLGTATAMLTPDENNTPQKAADTDRGPRSKLQYYSGYGTSFPAPNMQGVEQTYNRPYYAAKGGVTRMATGGITSAPRNQQQLFADYLQRVSSSGVSGGTTPPTNKYEWWKSSGTDTPAAAPAETAEEYAARTRANARGSSGGQSQEQKDQREADLDRVDDYLSTPENQVTMRQYWAMDKEARDKLNADAAERNPIRGAIYEGVTKLGYPMFLRGAEALQGVIKDFTGPSTKDPKSVGMVFPTEKDRIKAEEVAKYRQSLLGDTSGYTDTGTSEIDRVTTEDARNAAYQRAQAEAENDARMERDIAAATPFSGATSNVRYQYAGKEISAAEAKTLVDQGKYPTVISDATSANEAAARVAAAKIPATEAVTQTNAVLTGSPYDLSPFADKNITYTAAEQARIDRDAAVRSLQMAIERESPDSIVKYQTQVNDLSNKLAALNGEPSAVAQTDAALGSSYNLGPFTNSNLNDSPFNLGPFNAANTAATTAATTARINALRESIEKSPYEKNIEAQEKRDAAQEEKNAATQASLESAPSIPFSSSTIPTGTDLVGTSSSPLGTGTSILPNGPDLTGGTLPTINPKDPYAVDSDYGNFERAPYVPGAISAAPDDTTLSQFTNALYGDMALPVGYVGDATQLAGVSYTGGIPDATAGVPAPNMGRQSSGLAGISGSFGGLGSAWQGVTDRNGNPILTSQGAAENAFNVSPEGIAAENARETQSLQNRYPSGGRSSDGGDGGGYSGNNSGDNAGWGRRDAGADGGLSTPYGFQHMANGGLSAMANPYNLGSYSDGGRLLKGPGDGVSDSIPATIGKGRPARLADGEFVIPARIVSEIGNGSTEAGARKLYAMMDRIQAGRKKSVGKGKVAVNSRADKYLPA